MEAYSRQCNSFFSFLRRKYEKNLQGTMVGGFPICWIHHWSSGEKEKSIVKFVDNKKQKKSEKNNFIPCVFYFFPRFLEVLLTLLLYVVIKRFKYTDWVINSTKITNSNISTPIQSNGLIFWLVVGLYSNFFHRDNVSKCSYELLLLIPLKKFYLLSSRKNTCLSVLQVIFGCHLRDPQEEFTTNFVKDAALVQIDQIFRTSFFEC